MYHTKPEPVPSMSTFANRRNMRLFLTGWVQIILKLYFNCQSSFSFCIKKKKRRINLTNVETGRMQKEVKEKLRRRKKEIKKNIKWEKYNRKKLKQENEREMKMGQRRRIERANNEK